MQLASRLLVNPSLWRINHQSPFQGETDHRRQDIVVKLNPSHIKKGLMMTSHW